MQHRLASLRRNYLNILCLLIIVHAVLLPPCHIPPVYAWGDRMNKMTTKVARDMKRNLGSAVVYFDVQAFRNAVTGEIPILSIQLYNQLQAALSETGFQLAEHLADARYLVTCDFQTSGSKVHFYFKYFNAKTPDSFQTIKSSVKLKDLPKDAFMENLETKALKITSAILDNPAAFRRIASDGKRLRVFVNPIVESNYKYQSDFSENFLNKIRSKLIKADAIRLVEPEPVTLRTRGLVKRKSAKVKNLQTSEAILADAEAVMDGKYYVGKTNVTISLKIRTTDGTVIGSAEENIPRAMIALRLDNPVAEKAAQIADVSSQPNSDTVVKISTDKGGAHQIYHAGETITFMLQVAKPLYIYVYNINSNGEVEFLYPDENNNSIFRPGELCTIPPEGANWEIVVSAPFGLDNVILFACEKRLPLPRFSNAIGSVSFNGTTRSLVKKAKKVELARQHRINPLDLVEYFRGAALIKNAALYEDSIMITTKGN